MKKYTTIGFAFSHTLLLFLLVLLVPGCKKATEFPRNNPYDKDYKGQRNYSYSITPKIIQETKTADGKIEPDESVYYEVTIKNNGPEPALLIENVYFKPTYVPHVTSSNYTNVNPVGVVNDCVVQPGATLVPKSGTISGKTYSLKVMHSPFQAPSGSKVTYSCIITDYSGSETTIGTFELSVAY